MKYITVYYFDDMKEDFEVETFSVSTGHSLMLQLESKTVFIPFTSIYWFEVRNG